MPDIALSRRFLNQIAYGEAVASVASEENTLAVFEGMKDVAEGIEGFSLDYVASNFTLQRTLVEQAEEDYRARELTLASEVASDVTSRDKRDGAFNDLSDILDRVFTTLKGDVTPKRMRALGMEFAPPTTFDVIDDYAQNVVHQCRLEENQAPIQPLLGAPYTVAALAALIEPRLATYNALTQALDDDLRDTQRVRAERDVASDRFQRVVLNAARILEGLFRQANLDAIADRIRPSQARGSGRLDLDPLPDAPPTDPATPPDTP